MPDYLRKLAIGIGWEIDDRALLQADRRTDEYIESIERAERCIGDLGNRVSRVGGGIERDFAKMGRAVEDKLGRQVEEVGQEIRDLSRDADEAARGVERASKKMEKDLEQVEDKANNLGDILGGLGGAIGGGAVGGIIGADLTTFEQLPRELEAQLGVTESIAQELTGITKEIWREIPDISREGAAEAVVSVYRYFDATGERAKSLGRDIAMLWEQSDVEMTRLAQAANLMETRFADIKSPEEALAILTEASQRLPRDIFEELIDNVEEYGGNIAAAGLTAKDFFGAMIEGGERSRYVMDRLGDTLSNELIANIRKGEEGIMDALTVLGKSEEQANQWRQAVLRGGREGRTALKEIISTLVNLEDEQKRAFLGAEIMGEMYREQEAELLPIFDHFSQGYDKLGRDVESLAKRHEGPLNRIKTMWKDVRLEIERATGGAFGEATEVVGGLAPYIATGIGSVFFARIIERYKKGGISGIFKGLDRADDVLETGVESAESFKKAAEMSGKTIKGLGKVATRALVPLGIGLDVLSIVRAGPEERPEAIGEAVGGWGGAAAGFAAGSAIGSVVPVIGTFAGGAIGGIAGYFGGEAIGGKLGKAIGDIDFSVIPDKIREAKKEAVNWLRELPGDVAEQLGYMTGRAVGELEKLPGEFSAWFLKTKESAIQWIEELPNEIAGVIESIPGRVEGAINSVAESFMDLGRAIPRAIVSGFESGKEALGDAGRWIVDRVTAGIETFEKLGERFASGFERGKMAAHAEGGIFDRPHVALFAERGKEAVIPLEEHRERAIGIWTEVGRQLGVRASIPAPVFVGGGDKYVFAPSFPIYPSGRKGEVQEIERMIRYKVMPILQEFWNQQMKKMARARPFKTER